jgi:protein O-mannosyl-transferase
MRERDTKEQRPQARDPERCQSIPRRYGVAAVCVVLPLLVLTVFGQTVTHDFVNIDDNDYVYENHHVLKGLSGKGIAWAFAQADVSKQWQPLMLLSLMVDVQILKTIDGPRPSRLAAEMHAVNVALHAANCLLLFLLLRTMTGSVWRSASVAALFAVHPLHVESVAWITERKDVLSGLFGLLALWAYAGYARRPSVFHYLLVFTAMALGLMAKPMLVTWPFLMLLLDYWPLRRWQGAGSHPEGTGQRAGRRRDLAWLIVEKIPLLALAVASATVAFLAQKTGGTVVTLETASLLDRFARAGVLYFEYLGKTVWPVNLAAFYPRVPPADYLPSAGAASVILLLLTAAAVWGAWRGRQWLIVGWLWYLGTLLPTIQLVQVGSQVIADRFVYLPQIGICICIVWGTAEFLRSSAFVIRHITMCCSIVVLSTLTVRAWQQTHYWRDSETLWNHALACTVLPNPAAHLNLGVALAGRGKLAEAVEQYREVLRVNPNHTLALNELGKVLAKRGQFVEAIAYYRTALAIRPDSAEAHNNYGLALIGLKNYDEAAKHFLQAIEVKSDFPAAYGNLGNLMLTRGRVDEAIRYCRMALEISPDFPQAQENLAAALLERGEVGEAIDRYRKALQIRPDYPEALNGLAWIRATQSDAKFRDGGEAVQLALRAVELTPDRSDALDTLAAAYAEEGNFAEAVKTARKGVELAKKQNKRGQADDIAKKIPLYEAGRPFRDSP